MRVLRGALMVALVVALPVACAGCVGADRQADPDGAEAVLATEVAADERSPGPADDLARPVVQPAECPAALSSDDLQPEPPECGYLIVPEDRDDPAGQVVEIAWARLPGLTSDDPPIGRTPPLLVLPDGPGIGGLAEAGSWLDSPLREDRDVVLMDPRGTGRSFPSLDCGEPPAPGALPPDLVEDCRRDLTAEGIALEAYTTRAMAADAADLRIALELGQVDLLGIGHGGRIALGLLADHPDGIRAALLDSPVPGASDDAPSAPEAVQSALDRLFDRCAARGTCPADTAQQVHALIEGARSAGGEPDAGVGLVVAAAAAMRGLDGPHLVADTLLAAVRDADVSAARGLLAAAADQPPEVAEGVELTVACAELLPGEGSTEGLSPVGRAVAAHLSARREACASWPTATSGQAGPARAEAFVLVMTGELDPVSPPAWAARLSSMIEGARVVQVDGAGHRVHDIDDCTIGIVQRFLLRPGAVTDGDCAADTSAG